MGGHLSKQTVRVSTDVAANIVQTTAQNCVNVSYGDNSIAINGDYNSVEGVAQQVSVAIDSTCSTFAAQDSTFDSDLTNAVTQVLSDQEVALTGWLDNSKDIQKTHIQQSIAASFTQDTVQSCVSNLTGLNNLYVSGDGNVIRDVTQGAALNTISQCILQGHQTSDVVSDITNTVNQHSTYTDKNPLSFIGDALAALAESALAVAAVVFVVLICFVFLFKALRHHRAEAQAEARAEAPAAKFEATRA